MSTPLPVSADDKFERHYRQQLSSLMDGELPSEEARFLLRRLQHDDELSGCHERWQLMGDALRGQACAPAPLDFSARVRAAVAEDVRLHGAPSLAPARAPLAAGWKRWGGGAALAASVAVMAMFVSREQIEAPASAPSQVVATQAQMPSQDAVLAPEASSMVAPAAAAVAAVATATRVASAPSRREAVRGSATRTRQAAQGSVARVQEPVRAFASAPALPAVSVDPFSRPSPVVPARPWPRSSVSGSLPGGVLTVSTPSAGSGGAFYPFEPRLPADDAAAALPRDLLPRE